MRAASQVRLYEPPPQSLQPRKQNKPKRPPLEHDDDCFACRDGESDRRRFFFFGVCDAMIEI